MAWQHQGGVAGSRSGAQAAALLGVLTLKVPGPESGRLLTLHPGILLTDRLWEILPTEECQLGGRPQAQL